MTTQINVQFIQVLFLLLLITACNKSEISEDVRKITVSDETLALSIGESRQITALIYPYQEEGEKVIWSIKDSGIATINDNGIHNGVSVATITGISKGEIVITVKSSVDHSLIASISVSVVESTFENQSKGIDYTSDELITYRVPDGYPQEGDPLFNVSINEIYTGVYTDFNAWQRLVSFAYFDFSPSKEVDVVVTSSQSFSSYRILPESLNITSTREGNSIRFKMKETDQKLSIVFNESYKGNTFHIFANAIDIDAPTQSNENLIYFGPGFHDLSKTNGGRIITGNKNVYIAGGAVVSGSIIVNGNGNHVGGHGILMKTTPNDLVLLANYARHALIEGIIVCSHRNGGWTVGMHEASNITVENVKVVSPRYASTDGFDIVNSNNITIRNSFIRSCDDAIAIKGLINNIPARCPPNEKMLFENLQIWNDANNAMCLGAETRAMHYEDIHFRDIDVLFSYDDRDNHTRLDERSVMTIVCLEGTYFRNITWEDIRVNRCERLICQTFKEDFWFGSIKGDQTTEGGIDDVTYKNITVNSNSGSKIANEILLNGWYKPGTPTKLITNVTFDNVKVEGKLIHSESDIITNNSPEQSLVSNLFFK